MRTKTVFSILFFFIISGGLLVPLLGFGQLPPQERGISITVQFGTSTPSVTPSPPLPGVLSPEPFQLSPLGGLILRGFGPPGAFLTVKKNDVVGATARIRVDGTFSVIFSSIAENSYSIGLSAEDEEGNQSQTITLRSIPIFKDATTTIENILIPPTIFIDTSRVAGDENITLHGFAPPNANVNVFFSPSVFVKQITSGRDGGWLISFPARELGKGKWQVKVRIQLASGLISEFSQVFDVVVTSGPSPSFPPVPPSVTPPRAIPPKGLQVDLNGDGRVDIIDLSILLYHWGTPQDPRLDFNEDGVVDLIDFSVMLFWWTG